jgi:hypothetical protein
MLRTPAVFYDALMLLLGDNSQRSRVIVDDLLKSTSSDDVRKDIVLGDDGLLDVYQMLIGKILKEPLPADPDTVSYKYLIAPISSSDILKTHPAVREYLLDIVMGNETITASQIQQCIDHIRNKLIVHRTDASVRKIFGSIRRVSDIDDVSVQSAELDRLRVLFDDAVKEINSNTNIFTEKPSESYVDLSDEESVRKSIEKFVERSVSGVVPTGLIGLNRALGRAGGLCLGDSVVFAAPTHHYKSGMLVSIMLWSVIYCNVPPPPGKKALVYFVSLENEVHQNLMDVFEALYGRVEKKKVDWSVHTPDFITQWLVSYFSKYNVTLIIDRFKPHDFSFGKFIKKYNQFVEDGYHMRAFILDYLSEARGIDPGDTISTQGTIQLIREFYTKFFNHAKTEGYLFATGHQLIKRASEIAEVHRHAVKKFNPSLMADSSDVYRIIDVLIFLLIEENADGFKFLTMQLRKNRSGKDTPETHKFCAYPFTEFGIMDDYLGTPGYYTDIDAYGATGTKTEDILESALF